MRRLPVTLLVLALLTIPALGAGPPAPKKGGFIVMAGWAATGGGGIHDNGLAAGVEYMVSDAWSLRADYVRASSMIGADDSPEPAPIPPPDPEPPPTVPPPPPPVCHPVGHCDPGNDDPPPGHDPPGHGLALTLAPHWKAVSFPFGLVALDLPGRRDPAWGGTLGVWVDWWGSRTVGLGGGASYRLTNNTALESNVYDVRAGLRFKF